MTSCTPDYELATPTISVNNGISALHIPISAGKEARTSSEANTASFYSLISISGMSKTPVTVSKFVEANFSVLKNVQAVLAGESEDVLHVWIMIREWTVEARKAVYNIQKLVMKQLQGLHFDFYVIDLPQGTDPREMVSDIPIIFNRAHQEPSSRNR